MQGVNNEIGWHLKINIIETRAIYIRSVPTTMKLYSEFLPPFGIDCMDLAVVAVNQMTKR